MERNNDFNPENESTYPHIITMEDEEISFENLSSDLKLEFNAITVSKKRYLKEPSEELSKRLLIDSINLAESIEEYSDELEEIHEENERKRIADEEEQMLADDLERSKRLAYLEEQRLAEVEAQRLVYEEKQRQANQQRQANVVNSDSLLDDFFN